MSQISSPLRLNTIFTTAIIELNEDRPIAKTSTIYFNNFEKLCESRIPLVVYSSRKYKSELDSLGTRFSNILQIVYIDLIELETYKKITAVADISLPEKRYHLKDTLKYMILMQSKLEFIDMTIQNGIKSIIPIANYYSWIDFGIFHIIKDIPRAHNKLQMLSYLKWKKPCNAFAGIYDKPRDIKILEVQTHWRFCGGFFIIEPDIFYEFQKQYNLILDDYLSRKFITWEVNIWASMELLNKFEFGWYKADHNDTIFDVPI